MSLSMTAEKMFGPPLIGLLFNGILFGTPSIRFSQCRYDHPEIPQLSSGQAKAFFSSGERWTRYLVAVLLVLEILNSGIVFAMVYQGLFKNYGSCCAKIEFLQSNCEFLLFVKDIRILVSHFLLLSSISTIAQIYYAWRIRILTNSNVLAGFIFVLAWVSFAWSICGSVFTALHPNWDGIDNRLLTSLITWQTTSTVCDVVIAIAMVFYLTTHKKDSMAVTKSVVNRIIILTIQTGVITSVAAIASILTFTLVKQATMLNAREEWSKTLHAQNDVENISDVSFVHLDGLADYSQEKSQLYLEFDIRRKGRVAPNIKKNVNVYSPMQNRRILRAFKLSSLTDGYSEHPMGYSIDWKVSTHTLVFSLIVPKGDWIHENVLYFLSRIL
ncbi:hypothetical protein K435DRAFT_794890 [Dendrothele bispora CBS 962.96]|uniref:DUF6534 domain-containing protein n=1 Tax=Dendrothele bispora (strain CBS 962.96) TaxID=1314807 RepID=A0A4S8MB35_DENBC|nr:hypothetical protein K435DRAFT_794890 [Dendrothele bispora CBS 962.96]